MFLKTPLHEIHQAIKNKKISSYEMVSFYCNQIKKINPVINAVVQFDEENALTKAKEADIQRDRGHNLGFLHGIPFTAKDWFDTKDFISTAGFDERRNFIPEKDATVIARIQAAGGILLGKTNVPYKGTEEENPIYGRTLNPYNLEYSPGWSSGGEAAINSAGGSPFGIASDSGGSIRVPCHFCGLAGLKPTTGRIPSTGHYPEIGGFLDPRSQIGPISRHVDDLGYIYRILQGSDGIDPYVVETPHFIAPHLSELKVAYYINHHNTIPSADIVETLEKSVAHLRKSVKSVTFHEPKLLAIVMDITYKYWDIYKASPTTKEYLQLIQMWDEHRKNMWHYVQPYDAIITPVCSKTAHPYGKTDPELFPYTLTYSLTGWPCVTVRAGTSENGLPINLQIVAKPYHEEICLLIAKNIEEMCGWKEPNLFY
ncbi:MAG TPA: amidase [Gammaproteobacteria bacterium]|nr:amidase [Gammaproteobacteria bacterium]